MANYQPLKGNEVQSHKEGSDIKKEYPNAEIHLDHIPSKKAIELAYEDAIGKKLKRSLKSRIHAETTTLARAVETHRQSPTSKINVKLAHIDKDVLALAAVRDLAHYKAQELKRGVFSPEEIDAAIEKVHQRNYDLGIYTKEEVNIAVIYTQKLQELQLKKHVDIPSFEEVANEYHARFDEAPKINSALFDHRLAKPSIIVGATLASMVFTDKADASTLHPNPHLSKESYEDLTYGEQIGVNISAGFNALNALQAHEEFKAGASGSVRTLMDRHAYAQGLQDTFRYASEPMATKEVARMGVKESARFAGKSFLKKLPLIGFAAGIGFGISRAMDGDWNGAAMEVASGAFSLIPGIGTAASVGVDSALLEKDTGMLSGSVERLLKPQRQQEEIHNRLNTREHEAIETPLLDPNDSIPVSGMEIQEDYSPKEINGPIILSNEEAVHVGTDEAYYTISQDNDVTQSYEETFDSTAHAQRIYDTMAERQGWSSAYDDGLEMGMERE